MKRLIAAVMAGTLTVAVLSGCSAADSAERKIIQKDDKQIVVIDEKQKTSNNEIALDKIVELQGVRVLDWIDEDTILIMKDNENMPKLQVEGGLVYPKNFYEFDINTKEERLIAESEVNMVSGVMSPDKKHIFYKEGVEETMTGYILNRETGKKTKITGAAEIMFYEGRWVDNDTVIFASFPDSGIFTADVNGKKTEIPVDEKGMLNNAAKLGSNIYYTTIDGKLYVQDQDMGGKDKKQLGDNVIWLIPSPDMTQFAMVKRTGETEVTLYITDLNGKEIKTLAKATQIFGANWSPDGSAIVYSTMDMDNSSGGIFVADSEGEKIVQMTTEFEYVADPLRWSPSGKQISFTNLMVKEEGYELITNILQLK